MITSCDALPHPIRDYAEKYRKSLPAKLSEPAKRISETIAEYCLSDGESRNDFLEQLSDETKNALAAASLTLEEQHLAQVALMLCAEYHVGQGQPDKAYFLMRLALYPRIARGSDYSLVNSYVWFQFRILLGDYRQATSALAKSYAHYLKENGERKNLLTASVGIALARYGSDLQEESRRFPSYIINDLDAYPRKHSRILSAWCSLANAEYYLKSRSPSHALDWCSKAIKETEVSDPRSLLNFRSHAARAQCYWLMQDSEAGKKSIQELKALALVLDAEHAFVASVVILNLEAKNAYLDGHYHEGYDFAARASDKVIHKLYMSHPFAADSLLIASDCAFSMGEHQQSYKSATWAAKCTGDDSRHQWAESLWRQSRAAWALGERRNALYLRADALDMFRESYPKKHPRISSTRKRLEEMKKLNSGEINGIY